MRRQLGRVAIAVALLALLAAATAIADGVGITQKGKVRVKVTAQMSPKRLPRTGTAPISVSIGGQISTTDKSNPPQLEKLTIEINRNGRIDSQGLPTCQISQIQPASNSRALSVCRPALVGQGSFAGSVTLPGLAPYPISGRLLVFNGTEHGRPVLLGHIFSSQPFPTSFVIVFAITTRRHGTYGTKLTANLARSLGKKRNLTALKMTLSRRYSAGGERRSYVSAGCPAPKGFQQAPFSLARTSFFFAAGRVLSTTLTSDCTVRR
jgi:hypothetical protein